MKHLFMQVVRCFLSRSISEMFFLRQALIRANWDYRGCLDTENGVIRVFIVYSTSVEGTIYMKSNMLQDTIIVSVKTEMHD